MPEGKPSETIDDGPDRLGLTIQKLNHLYEVLDYARSENAIVSTAGLLISTLSDDEIDHGINRSMGECRRAIAKDIIDRAKDDEPIPGLPMEGLPRLNAALAKAQGEFPVIPKTRTATKRYKRGDEWKEFTYNYADLADILKAVYPALSKQGLSITQPFRRKADGYLYLVTELRHSSGEVLTSAGLRMHEVDVTPQDFGSEHSYWRRYDLSGLLGVAATEDDDGQFASRSKDEPGGTTERKSSRRTERDKSALEPGDPNRGHGAENTASSPQASAVRGPAPVPIITDEQVTVLVGENKEKKVMPWKKIVARVKNVSGVLRTAKKTPYMQVVVEGLEQAKKKDQEYKPNALFHCFRTTLHAAVKFMPGEICTFYFDPAESAGTFYQNIEEILKIGEMIFQDGKRIQPETKAAEPTPAVPQAADKDAPLTPDLFKDSQVGTTK